MSFEGFLRLHQFGIFSVAVVVVLFWIIVGLFIRKLRSNDQELAQYAQTVRRYVVAVILVLFAIGLAYSAMSNQTPRAVIDRTDVNRQQDQHEQDVQQRQREAEASQKEKSR